MNLDLPINPGPLTEGVHMFYVRARNASGTWRVLQTPAIFKPIGSGGVRTRELQLQLLISLSWNIIDIDPGFRKGYEYCDLCRIRSKDIIVPINPVIIPAKGVHRFMLARNGTGAWV